MFNSILFKQPHVVNGSCPRAAQGQSVAGLEGAVKAFPKRPTQVNSQKNW